MAPMTCKNAPLPYGNLELLWNLGSYSFSDLCDVGCRRNPKRPFLFVSKVLGRYRPVRPDLFRTASRALADRLESNLAGPVLFIGLAEAGVGLGNAVCEDYRRRTGRDDVILLPTTRYRLDRPILSTFVEEHSHAPTHFIYEPNDPELRRRVRAAETLIMVDDEATTGNTFANLASTLQNELTSLTRVLEVTVTDWRGMPTIRGGSPNHEAISLLSGSHAFRRNATSIPLAESAVGSFEYKDEIVGLGFGREGLSENLHLSTESFTFPPGRSESILVVGTGEFVYPPFLLAEQLQRSGHNVHFVTSTRSPVELGGAVQTAFRFTDNYQDGIPNFLYNVSPEDYSRILICIETPPATAPVSVVQEMGAEFIHFQATDGELSTIPVALSDLGVRFVS
jgi:hypothetical protein